MVRENGAGSHLNPELLCGGTDFFSKLERLPPLSLSTSYLYWYTEDNIYRKERLP